MLNKINEDLAAEPYDVIQSGRSFSQLNADEKLQYLTAYNNDFSNILNCLEGFKSMLDDLRESNLLVSDWRTEAFLKIQNRLAPLGLLTPYHVPEARGWH
jgi:hypothetical protein